VSTTNVSPSHVAIEYPNQLGFIGGMLASGGQNLAMVIELFEVDERESRHLDDLDG
jgi:hypothetical protein